MTKQWSDGAPKLKEKDIILSNKSCILLTNKTYLGAMDSSGLNTNNAFDDASPSLVGQRRRMHPHPNPTLTLTLTLTLTRTLTLTSTLDLSL